MRLILILSGVVTGLAVWLGWCRWTPDDEVSPHWLDQRSRWEMDHAQHFDGPAWTWPLRPEDRELDEDDDQWT